jgi:hypothetical protein
MSQAFPPLSPEYDAFLYAIVCNDKNGMHLTMASLIARSGADPWNEAARISRLQKDAALNVLARLIEEHDGTEQKPPHKQITLDQLLSLLPKSRPILAANVTESIRVRGISLKTAGLTIAATLCIFIILAYLFTAMLRLEPERQTQKPEDLNSGDTQH